MLSQPSLTSSRTSNQNTSAKNYVAQVPRGIAVHVFKQPALTSSFPYTAKFDLPYHSASHIDPNWYHTQPQANVPVSTKNTRTSDHSELQRSHYRTSGNFCVYNDYYSALSDVDTASTSTLSPSIFSPSISTDTTAASSIIEEPVARSRASTPGPSSLRRSSSITRTQPKESVQPPPAPTPRTAMLPSQTTAIIARAPSYTYDDYLCPTPATFGNTDDLDERNLLARRNAELNASASRRESLVLSLPPPDITSGNGDSVPLFPTIPLSASPEPIISTQVTANSAYSASDIIPFPSSLSVINVEAPIRLVSDDDQFIPPLDLTGKDPGRPIERPESRADRRRPASQDQNLRTSALTQYAFPPVNSNDQPRVPRSRSNSISRHSPDSTLSLSRRNSIVTNNGQYMSHKSVQSLAQSTYSIAPYYYYQAAPNLSTMASVTAGVPAPATQNPLTKVISPVQYTRSRKSSLVEPIAQRESQSQETRPMLSTSLPLPPVGVVPFNLDRRGSDGDVPVSRSRTEMPRRLSDSDAPVMIQYAVPPGHEPQRRHSDGDQYKKGSVVRTVRWNENLICPSPIGAEQRRKGWFNRRGDQLWTNGGAYKPPPPGQEFPLDLDGYPDYGQGWMNENGIRIDMVHRLIPKLPLRSALKQTRA